MGLPTVDPFLSASQYETVENTLTQEAQTTLETAAAPLRANSLQVDTVILAGVPAEAILSYISENQIDLLVMSTHGRTGLARLVFGSVAESIVHRATCPVLLVRVAGE
jgi:nucleotide-binding universal stress UspA family protein